MVHKKRCLDDTSKESKGRKKNFHIIRRTAQKKDDDVIKQAKARGEIISFRPLISVVVIDLKHVIRDRRSSALQTLFFPPKFWRLRHFCTFSSAQSSVSQRAQGWQGFPT